MENTSQSSNEDQSTRSRSALADKVKQDSRDRLERGKQVAADQVEQIADALDQAGSRLNDGQPTIASYATRMADGLDQLAQRLRSSSLEELTRDTRTVATRNPAAFLLGSAAVGLLLARFLKASMDTDQTSSSFSSGLEGDSDSDAASDLTLGSSGLDDLGSTGTGGSTGSTGYAGATGSGSSTGTGTAESSAAGTPREPSSTSRGIH
ncbi:MAG: hypothetical protein ACJ8MR_14450 [Povalibacter sp.]